MTIRDGQYAVCPFCGEKHGDCWEWLTSESPQETECQSCGKTFIAWAEYDVQYVTKAPQAALAQQPAPSPAELKCKVCNDTGRVPAKTEGGRE